MSDTVHESGTSYWEAGAEECPHAPEPNSLTDGDAWDAWRERHPSSDLVSICLDAPAGNACLDCSAEEGDMVPWSACRVRDHRRPAKGAVANPDAEHQPMTVWVGPFWCLERECDEYFTDDGETDPGVERCSHIREELACSCQRQADGDYTGTCSATQPLVTATKEN